MTNLIKLKRSTVAGKMPLASDLDVGELAVNVADGFLYLKQMTNNVASIVKFAPVASVASGVGVSFFAFNQFHDESPDSLFVPPCPIYLKQFYGVTNRIKSHDVICSLYLNTTTLLGTCTIPANSNLSNRLTFMNPPTIGITDILSIDYDSNDEHGVCLYVTW